MTAKFLRTLSGGKGRQTLWQLSEPLDGHEFVVVSSVNHSFAHETMIFPGSADCDAPTDFMDLACIRNSTDHERILREAGYTISR